ncbi:IS200/IS605 family transposase [Planctomycetota bacterium]
MAHTFINLLTHIIFSTKNHAPFLEDPIKPDLYAYLGGIIRQLDSKLIIVNGPADHLHMLVSLSSQTSVAELLRLVKTNSSRWMHEKFPALNDFAWQIGYAAFSVSQSNLQSVQNYIAQQPEHHRRVTFQEEYINFLNKHGIEYDQRFIFD